MIVEVAAKKLPLVVLVSRWLLRSVVMVASMDVGCCALFTIVDTAGVCRMKLLLQGRKIVDTAGVCRMNYCCKEGRKI